MIMPLANERDKITQVRWGIKDFQSRFGRFPEGMWLAETAVDYGTLEYLASEGIKFTILARTRPKLSRRSMRKTGRM
jgi:alpha-amylase/alpha-mannosidase (GH57 family)